MLALSCISRGKDGADMKDSPYFKDEKDFLISVKQGVPRWDLMPITGLDKLPAIQWKLMNIRKMNRTRHALAVNKLRRVLER